MSNLTKEQLNTLEEASSLLKHLWKEWYYPFKFNRMESEQEVDPDDDEENQEFYKIIMDFRQLVKQLRECEAV